MTEQTLRDRLASAVMQTLIDASKVEGEDVSYLPAAEASEALSVVLAMLIEGAPNVRTPKDMREMSEAFSRDVLRHVKALRAIYQQTGRRPLDGATVRPN